MGFPSPARCRSRPLPSGEVESALRGFAGDDAFVAAGGEQDVLARVVGAVAQVVGRLDLVVVPLAVVLEDHEAGVVELHFVARQSGFRERLGLHGPGPFLSALDAAPYVRRRMTDKA